MEAKASLVAEAVLQVPAKTIIGVRGMDMSDNPFADFGRMLDAQGGGCTTIGQALCARLSVPYLKDRESEQLLGHRPRDVPEENVAEEDLFPTRRFRHQTTGEVLCTDVFPDENYDQLTEEVWSRNNWPDSYNDSEEAVAKLGHGIIGIYYHRPSMNLVLVDSTGLKVGIRSTALMTPMGGLNKRGCLPLAQLKKATLS